MVNVKEIGWYIMIVGLLGFMLGVACGLDWLVCWVGYCVLF